MSTHVDPVPYEARPFQGRRAGLATRAAAAVIDVAIVLIALGVGYVGICCGNSPHLVRSMAEALGRTPPASRYSADMSKHAYFGDDASLKDFNQEFAEKL